jgi:hypothetical protein
VRGRRIAKALMWQCLDAVLGMSRRPRDQWYSTVDHVRIGPYGRETSFVVLRVALLGIRWLRLPLLVGGLTRQAGRSPPPSAPETARNLISGLADRHPQRRLHVVVGDGLVSPALRDLPANVAVTVRMPANAVLHGPTPPKTGRPGRPRRQGDRLGNLSEVAASGGFTEIVTPEGATAFKRMTAQWYSVFAAQPVQIVLARRRASQRAFDIALASTDLEADADELLARYRSVHEAAAP